MANARDLLEEARLLFAHKHYPRAFVLAQLASEEFTKAHLLLSLGLMRAVGLNPPMELFWSWWIDHDEKGTFKKSWDDMFAGIDLEEWKRAPIDVVKDTILGAVKEAPAKWPARQTQARQTSTWREDATYVDFRNARVLVPRGRIGRGRAKRKIDEVTTFAALVGQATEAPALLTPEQEGEVGAFVQDVMQNVLTIARNAADVAGSLKAVNRPSLPELVAAQERGKRPKRSRPSATV